MKIVIAGGGTGGHIYPAISIARALQEANPDIKIEFVGTRQGLETKIMEREGYKLNLILSGQLNFQGNFLQKIKTILKIPIGLLQSALLLFKIRPHFVLGVGGYASAPFVLMSSLLGFKTALWEPNAHPGMANRILSRFVNRTYLVFDHAKKYLKSKDNFIFGMPLRPEIEQAREAGDTRVAQYVDSKFNILCFGGSQGSVFLNNVLSDFILTSPELYSEINVVHQTGPRDFERIKQKYAKLTDFKKNIELFDFIYEMPRYLQKADLLLCRGGASTLAEAAAFGAVPIIIPLPAADNHQQRNAENLIEKNAAFMMIQDSFAQDEFKRKVIQLMTDRKLKIEMSNNLKQLAPKKAANMIAQDILTEINNNTAESNT